MQPSGTGPPPATYITTAAYGTPALHTSSTRRTSGAYLQLSGPTSTAYLQHSGPTSRAYLQPSGPTSTAYLQPSGPKSAAYVQPPCTGLPPAAHTPSGIGLTSAAYMQPSGIGSTTAAHTQPLGIGHKPAAYTQSLTGPGDPAVYHTPAPYATPADHTQPSTGPAYLAVHHPLSASQPPETTITTSIGHGRELSNLAEIYTNSAKYSGRNDSFTFNLAIFQDIRSRADVPPEAKM